MEWRFFANQRPIPIIVRESREYMRRKVIPDLANVFPQGVIDLPEWK